MPCVQAAQRGSTSAGQMSAQVTRLSAWLHSAGISWDEGLIQVRPAGGGLGVFARVDIQVLGRPVMRCVCGTGILSQPC